MGFRFPFKSGFAVGLWVRGWENVGLRNRWLWVRVCVVFGLRIRPPEIGLWVWGGFGVRICGGFRLIV